MSGLTWTRGTDENGRRTYTSNEGHRITTDGIPSWPYTLYYRDGSTFIAHRLYVAKLEAETDTSTPDTDTPEEPTMPTAIETAAARLDALDGHLWDDVAGTLTFTEADTLANLFAAVGCTPRAYDLMAAWWKHRGPADDDEHAPALVAAWLPDERGRNRWDEAARAYADAAELALMAADVLAVANEQGAGE